MKLHCFMQIVLWIWLAVLPQLDPSLISAFFSHSVSLLFPPLSSFLSPHYHRQISLIMKYCYCMTAKMGRRGRNKALKLLIIKKNKKKNWVSGFSIRAYTLEHPPPPSLYHHHTLCVVFMCEQEHFFKYIGGVISL